MIFKDIHRVVIVRGHDTLYHSKGVMYSLLKAAKGNDRKADRSTITAEIMRKKKQKKIQITNRRAINIAVCAYMRHHGDKPTDSALFFIHCFNICRQANWVSVTRSTKVLYAQDKRSEVCERLTWASVNGREDDCFRGNHAMVSSTVAETRAGTNSAQSRRIIRLIGSFMLIF